MRALLAHKVAPFIRPACPDHLHTGSASKLNSGDTDAAARSVNENSLARSGLGSLKQSAIRSRIRDVDRRALRVRDLRRQRMRLGFIA